MALTSVAFAVRAVSSGRWLPASVAMALAVDSKAWAALALPLAIGLSLCTYAIGRRRRDCW
jgi:hypothetical protein